jgi:hypothetical protein
MMTLNEIRYNPATSTFFSLVDLAFESPHTQNTFLCIESTEKYTHHKQVKVYYYIEKKKVDDCKVKIITFVI